MEFNLCVNHTQVFMDLYKGVEKLPDLEMTVWLTLWIKSPLCRQGLILELNNHLIRLHPLCVTLNRISRVLFLFPFILFSALIYCAVGKRAGSSLALEFVMYIYKNKDTCY